MAGIIGYRNTVFSDVPAALLADLSRPMRRRGPDAVGAWWDQDANVALGHRLFRHELHPAVPLAGNPTDARLGVAGAPPALSPSGRWVVVFDGRLDGMDGSGRAAVDPAGEVGSTGAVAAAVLAGGLDEWGVTEALERLDGPFALAVWDRRERELWLARDAFGRRPLVYSQLRGGVVFASDLDALRRVPGFDDSVDPAAVAAFLRFKYVPSPHTIHADARKVEPGRVVVFTDEDLRSGREPRAHRVRWFAELLNPAARSNTATHTPTGPVEIERHLDTLDAVIARSVGRALRDPSPMGHTGPDGANAPAGAFLSGGVDSTLIASIAASQLDEPLRTFTIGSDGPDVDESAEARAVAAHLGTDHHEIRVTGAEVSDEVPDLATHWDEPFADSSQLPMLLVSRLARDHVPAALSGDGGDELFGGYNRHLWLPRTWERLGRLPMPVRRAMTRMLEAPRPSTWDRAASLLPASRRPRMAGLKAAKFASVLGAADPAEAYRDLVSHWREPIALLAPGFVRDTVEAATVLDEPWDRSRGGSLAETIMAADLCTYLPDDVLVKVDGATTAAGLDARSPLLGREVVETAFDLPMDLKIRDGVGKWALRRLILRRLPRELVERPKSGFGIPIATWLRGPLRPWAEDLLDPVAMRREGLLDPAPITAAWNEHRSGRSDRSYELWDVLMLVSWFRRGDTS